LLIVTTDPITGLAPFMATLDRAAMPGKFLTATAIDLVHNDTSEFSAGVEITDACPTPSGGSGGQRPPSEFWAGVAITAAGAGAAGTGRPAAWAPSRSEADRPAPPVLLPSREHTLAGGTLPQADGVPSWYDRPDRTAADAFFGGTSPVAKGVLSKRTAAA